MPKAPLGVTVVIAITLYAIFATSPGLAGDAAPAPSPQDFLVWTSFTGTDGLTRQIPDVDTLAFAEHITQLQARLNRQREELADLVEDNAPGISDAILTVILPGGLVYAGIRQRSCNRTRQELARVSALIDTLSRNLLQYQYATGVVVFAQLQ